MIEVIIPIALVVVGFIGKDYIVRLERQDERIEREKLLNRIQAPKQTVDNSIAEFALTHPPLEKTEPQESEDGEMYLVGKVLSGDSNPPGQEQGHS